jgi:acetyl esterase/lipase
MREKTEQERPRLIENIPYYAEERKPPVWPERCVLDVRVPAAAEEELDTLVWLHGGGLTANEKSFPAELLDSGLALVAVNYRLVPRVEPPECVADAAAAIAWVFRNIAGFGGNPERIFISGHSAGAYLGDLVVMDRTHLQAHGIDANRVAGHLSLSAQKVTHFVIRERMGLPAHRIVVDTWAPLHHVRADAPPTLLLTGGRDKDLPGRYEENALYERMMRLAGHQDIDLIEIPGADHAGMISPAFGFFPPFIRRVSRRRMSGI